MHVSENFWVASDVVWWPGAPAGSRDRVAVVSVSYNTRELTALLVWSLRRIVNWPGLQIVIVDNGSRDGSAELLAEAGQAGVCVALANDVNLGHGPGLKVEPMSLGRIHADASAVAGPCRETATYVM